MQTLELISDNKAAVRDVLYFIVSYWRKATKEQLKACSTAIDFLNYSWKQGYTGALNHTKDMQRSSQKLITIRKVEEWYTSYKYLSHWREIQNVVI